MNWLQRLAYGLEDEVFIDDSGFVYGADGDIGPSNHDAVVLETVLGCLDDFEELQILDVMDLTEQQMREVDASYPGFVEYVAAGGLPKEYAVEHMGWIRVLGANFETQNVNNTTLNHIADYVHDSTDGDMDATFSINEHATNIYEDFTLGELLESLQSGTAVTRYRMKANRPGGLY